ncbi:hypothetical protein HU200_030492 [Digitaria exilis]|uniref:Uncharacterized protein n=1 Tax=Digitaria exilis TaxID=1010633 RepID=A0A835ES48_9POAL|nr:hypothetical protein HU200_030492 [Digitaria exilis]
MESKMERMSSSVQSWVEEHKLATIDANLCGAGGVWAAAAGASVAYSRRGAPQRARKALSLAVLGGAAAAWMHHRKSTRRREREQMDLDFYSQLPPATDADGNENERWTW